jgi:hypothetical protein
MYKEAIKTNARKQCKSLFYLILIVTQVIWVNTTINAHNQAYADAEMFGDYLDIVVPEKDNPQITRLPQKNKKPWTFMVYMAADNDLNRFAIRNIKQMALIGSNENVNIIVQLDTRIAGNHKVTRRFYIENNRILHTNANDPYSQKMDSGDPRTLISFCEWGITNYPAQEYALILWNHGTGILDPVRGRAFNPVELFSFNPSSNRLELDRTIGLLDLIDGKQEDTRGICWDSSTGNYLTNQKLKMALNESTQRILGKKFSLIGFDACLMSMVGVGVEIKDFTNIMVGSQEVELGTGWDYSKVLSVFTKQPLEPAELATHIVDAYENTYNTVTNDYTQSAINLENIDLLEQNINELSGLLLECLKKQRDKSAHKAIWASRHKSRCTHFDEPSYLDLYHLYSNLQENAKIIHLINAEEEEVIKQALRKTLQNGKQIITKIIVANKAGKNLKKAHGISIYFPERNMYPSYEKTAFATTNSWYTFINQYLLTT